MLSVTASAIGLGLLYGFRHAAEADHVVAVATIASREKTVRGAALIGGAWGLGHAIMLWSIGALVLLARVELPPRVALAGEILVGLLLIGLGSSSLRKSLARSKLLEARGPSDGAQSPSESAARRHASGRSLSQSFFLGTAHGLAGSAAALLLALAVTRSAWQGFLYLVLFGAGIVAGMLALSTAFAFPLRAAGQSRIVLRVGVGALGALSVLLGFWVVWTALPGA